MPFDKEKAEEVIEFIQYLKLVGDFTGQPFVLQKWQKEILRNVYGTVNDSGYRQYQFIYLEVPKKNGKTPLVAALGLYHLVNDPPGGEIYCCAAERDQAAQTYNYMKSMIDQDETLSDLLRVVDSKKEIHNDNTGTFVKVLSAEAYSKHGKAPSVVIFDELHAFQNRGLWDTMTFGSGSARKEPLYLSITTAGDDPDKKSIGWEIHEKACDIRDGKLLLPNWYVKIYGAPDDADIYDEQTWYDCNPSLGVSVSLEALRNEAMEARSSPSIEKLFRWLRLNQWVQLKRLGWLPITLWDDTDGDWTREELKGQECYVGIDLSTTTDLTATAPTFPPNSHRGWRFFIDAFIPEENMRERENRDHVPFSKWVKRGDVIATPGNVVDYGAIAEHIKRLDRDYRVKFFCGDAWHLEILKQLLPDEIQERFITIPQNMAGMSPAMHELERLFRSGEIEHEKNQCGRWAFGNVMIAIDGNENKKPMKNRSIERIDPICALINATAGAIKNEPEVSVYESRGLRFL